jgi:hypothetical protein
MADEQVRLLLCLNCKTVEDLPDYTGHPDGDTLLQHLIDVNHTDRNSGTTHVGNLVRIPKKAWDVDSERKQILAKINEGANGGETGLGSSFYGLKETYKDDAMSCWKQHNRNPACGDYMSEKKVLGVSQDVKDAWSAAGQKRPKNFGAKEYLCRFCPVHSMAIQALREKTGQYK